MSQMSPKSAPVMTVDESFDSVVDEVIAAAGGDLRSAISGLVRGQHAIEAEARASTSAGYVRRGLR
jgi:hypothetical protein